jgi:hypothetical protein
MSPTLTLRHLSCHLLRLPSPPLATSRRRQSASTAAMDSAFTGPVFVAASVRALLPPPHPSSKTLHRGAKSAFAVTLRGGTSAEMMQRLTRSSLTETGRTTSSRLLRYPSTTSRLTGLAVTPSPARAPIPTRSLPTLATASAPPSSFSGGVFFLPSSPFSLQNFPIKSRSYTMSRRTGSCVKCVAFSDHVCTSTSHSCLRLSSQPLAIWSSLFLVVNWAVNAALVPGPVLLIDKIFLYGVRNTWHFPVAFSLTALQIAPACTLPVLALVIYDWPRDRPNAYQVVLAVSIWSWWVL